MNKITGLKAARGRDKRINLYLDGRFALKIQAETALKEGLKVGQELPAERLESLAEKDLRQRCYNTAVRYLAYRPRSETEVRQRLQRHGYESGCIESTVNKLKSQGFIDDVAFARFWKENRESFRPQSRRLTSLELLRKGLNKEIIDEVVKDVDDGEFAYRAAVARAGRLPTGDFQVFRRRLGQFLVRKGFDYGTVQETVARVWKEYGNGTSELPDEDPPVYPPSRSHKYIKEERDG